MLKTFVNIVHIVTMLETFVKTQGHCPQDNYRYQQSESVTTTVHRSITDTNRE